MWVANAIAAITEDITVTYVIKTGRCGGCERDMQLAARGLCNTCYRNRAVITCQGCGLVRRPWADQLCDGCWHRRQRGDIDNRVQHQGDYFGPRAHHRMTPRPRRLQPHEQAALRDVYRMWP